MSKELWRDFAACRDIEDPNIFFPGQREGGAEAKLVCAGCPARKACLEFAITNGEKFGIWGGMSEKQRNKIRKQRRLQREAAAA